MVTSKYKVCKNKIGKTKTVSVNGVKKVCYNKKGTTKMYIKSKGRFMSLTKYKKMKSKQSGGEVPPYHPSLIGGKKRSKKGKKGKGKRK